MRCAGEVSCEACCIVGREMCLRTLRGLHRAHDDLPSCQKLRINASDVSAMHASMKRVGFGQVSNIPCKTHCRIRQEVQYTFLENPFSPET